MSLDDNFFKELERIKAHQLDEDEYNKSLETVSEATDGPGIQNTKVRVTNHGNFVTGWHRVEVHQPFLNELLSMTELRNMVRLIRTGANLGKRIPGMPPHIGAAAGAMLAAVIGAMIWFKADYIKSKDNGKGIYFTINRAELGFLFFNYWNPSGLSGYAMAKPLHTL